jgi:hypothetical protein
MVAMVSVAALLLVAGMANASIVAVGDPVEGDSWSQQFVESGVGLYNFMGIQMLSPGDTFNSPAFSGFSQGGWTTSSNALAGIASGPSVTSMTFYVRFADNKAEPFQFQFSAFFDDDPLESVIATWSGSGWGIAGADSPPTREECENAAIPEPASIIVWGLLGAGCAGGAVAARRRKRRAPWSDETRHDIHNIIDQGRTNA